MDIKVPVMKSVMVFASYRTGSTALCDYYASKMPRTVNWDEAFHSNLSEKTQQFKEYVSNGNRFVVKIMPDHFLEHQEYITELAKDCYLIKISRTDVAAQAASMYCCYCTDNWHLQKDAVLEQYQVEMDPTALHDTFNDIINFNHKLDQVPFMFDQIYDYQSLGHIQSKYNMMSKPTNYREVLNFMSLLPTGVNN